MQFIEISHYPKEIPRKETDPKDQKSNENKPN